MVKLTVDKVLNIYKEKMDNNQKLSWSIFKKYLTTKNYPVFKQKAESLYGDSLSLTKHKKI